MDTWKVFLSCVDICWYFNLNIIPYASILLLHDTFPSKSPVPDMFPLPSTIPDAVRPYAPVNVNLILNVMINLSIVFFAMSSSVNKKNMFGILDMLFSIFVYPWLQRIVTVSSSDPLWNSGSCTQDCGGQWCPHLSRDATYPRGALTLAKEFPSFLNNSFGSTPPTQDSSSKV